MATAKKKPVAKKATAKKPVAKKTATKKPVTRKPATKPPAKKATAKTTSTRLPPLPKPSTRRPDPNPVIPQDLIAILAEYFNNIKLDLEDYAAHMRPLDRSRVNGVGIRRQGFIEAALRLSTKFPQYFPHWLNCQKAEGFLARSLRIAQTPHIYSWSFAKGKTPKLSGAAG